MNHIHISTSKSNRRKARGEVQLYNTSKQKKEKTQEVADKLDHGVFKKSCGCLRMGVFGYMIKAGIENWQKIKKGKQESENEEGGANG